MKSVLIHTFLILCIYRQDTLHVREEECEDHWLFFEAKSSPRANKIRKQWYRLLAVPTERSELQY